jgi:two-component sensor histidine kinase/CHASE1-domain containing sensor protein
MALLTLAVGLAATVLAWRFVELRDERLAVERFENVGARFVGELERHQRVHEQALRAGAALVTLDNSLDAARWRSLYEVMRIGKRLPGIQGFGFARAVREGGLDAHEASVRAQGFPNYRVTPEGERPLMTPIVFLEPFDWRNQRAHGYDMYSEPARREAMTRAAATGRAAKTARVTLVQETEADVQAGFLLYVPVYSDVGAEPDAALVGFAFSPIRAADFFRLIQTRFERESGRIASIEVFDGDTTAPDALLFASADDGSAGASPVFEHRHELFGHTWTVRLRPLPAFNATPDLLQPDSAMLFDGLIVSLLAAALAWSIAQRRRQRQEAASRHDVIAREMSHRFKNLLAVIQSIASRSLSEGRSLEEARTVFSDRIAALARAHNALVDGEWSGAMLYDLLEGELSPFGARVAMHGPAVRVNSQMAQHFAMAVHELATNAVKYGALSSPLGRVAIDWSVKEGADGERFRFSWVEEGGPPASEPGREGFGQTLLRRLIGSTVGAEPEIEYAPTGLRYTFECDLARVGEHAGRRPSIERAA